MPFSHRDAALCLRSGWRRGSNALAELQHFGFIKSRVLATPGPGPIRPATEWQFTAFPCGGQPASKAFLAWSGDTFEPPYRGKHGSHTRDQLTSADGPEQGQEYSGEGQAGVGNMKTSRRQREDAGSHEFEYLKPEAPKSVGNMKTLLSRRRRQHEDTITYTKQGAAKLRPLACGAAGPDDAAAGADRDADSNSDPAAEKGVVPDHAKSDVAGRNTWLRMLHCWRRGGPAPSGLGERMRRWREVRGWSQTHLAEKTGIRQPKLSKLENGRQNVNRADYEVLVKALAIDPLQVRPMLEWQHSS